MVKGGRCPFIMGPTVWIISQSHHLLRTSEVSLPRQKDIASEGHIFHSLLFPRTQLPHAVGAAYSLKMDKKDACAITYFGDGGTSEVDENSPATDHLLASTIISSLPDRWKMFRETSMQHSTLQLLWRHRWSSSAVIMAGQSAPQLLNNSEVTKHVFLLIHGSYK